MSFKEFPKTKEEIKKLEETSLSKNMKIKAPNYFVKLYEEAQKEQDYVFDYLEDKVGYGKHWIVQNIKTCLDQLTEDKKSEMLNRLDKAINATNYAWAKFNYENWDKYKNAIRFAPQKYDKKKKAIILVNPTKINKFVKGLKKTVNDLVKKHEPKKRKRPRPKSIGQSGE